MIERLTDRQALLEAVARVEALMYPPQPVLVRPQAEIDSLVSRLSSPAKLDDTCVTRRCGALDALAAIEEVEKRRKRPYSRQATINSERTSSPKKSL